MSPSPRTRRTHEDNRISGKRGECPAGLCCVSSPRASFYRWQDPEEDDREERQRPVPPLALSGEEKWLFWRDSPRRSFVDQAPLEIYNTLLDEGHYLCSVRTMYRILEKHEEVKEREISFLTPITRSPSCLQRRQINSGHGTSRNSKGRQSGRTITST